MDFDTFTPDYWGADIGRTCDALLSSECSLAGGLYHVAAGVRNLWEDVDNHLGLGEMYGRIEESEIKGVNQPFPESERSPREVAVSRYMNMGVQLQTEESGIKGVNKPFPESERSPREVAVSRYMNMGVQLQTEESGIKGVNKPFPESERSPREVAVSRYMNMGVQLQREESGIKGVNKPFPESERSPREVAVSRYMNMGVQLQTEESEITGVNQPFPESGRSPRERAVSRYMNMGVQLQTEESGIKGVNKPFPESERSPREVAVSRYMNMGVQLQTEESGIKGVNKPFPESERSPREVAVSRYMNMDAQLQTEESGIKGVDQPFPESERSPREVAVSRYMNMDVQLQTEESEITGVDQPFPESERSPREVAVSRYMNMDVQLQKGRAAEDTRADDKTRLSLEKGVAQLSFGDEPRDEMKKDGASEPNLKSREPPSLKRSGGSATRRPKAQDDMTGSRPNFFRLGEYPGTVKPSTTLLSGVKPSLEKPSMPLFPEVLPPKTTDDKAKGQPKDVIPKLETGYKATETTGSDKTNHKIAQNKSQKSRQQLKSGRSKKSKSIRLIQVKPIAEPMADPNESNATPNKGGHRDILLEKKPKGLARLRKRLTGLGQSLRSLFTACYSSVNEVSSS